MRHDLYSLQLFRTVARAGSIARAAEEENIAASAVSKRLADLEAELGTPLLYRTQQGVRPTPAGTELLRHVDGVARRLERMEAEIGEFASGARGQVRIAANTSAITQFLPEDLAIFVKVHPEVRIELFESTSDEISNMVRFGQSDLGIVSGFVATHGIQSILYRRDTLVIISPRGYGIGERGSVTFEEILGHDLVGLQEGSSLQAFLDRKARELGETLSKRVEVMSFDGVRRMVEAGLGIAVLPLGAVEPYTDSTALQITEINEEWADRELHAIVRSIESLSRPAKALLDHLQGGA